MSDLTVEGVLAPRSRDLRTMMRVATRRGAEGTLRERQRGQRRPPAINPPRAIPRPSGLSCPRRPARALASPARRSMVRRGSSYGQSLGDYPPTGPRSSRRATPIRSSGHSVASHPLKTIDDETAGRPPPNGIRLERSHPGVRREASRIDRGGFRPAPPPSPATTNAQRLPQHCPNIFAADTGLWCPQSPSEVVVTSTAECI